MDIRFHSSIKHIGADTWQRLCGNDYPFLRYEFLAALESSQCTTADSGWQPHHLSLEKDGETRAVMPLYIKHHSYGEYVFDWGWADAYHRHGLDYYPKLLNAVPFTPATGPRIGIDSSLHVDTALPSITRALEEECRRLRLSSCHCLFTTAELSEKLKQQGFVQRSGHQYHWLNQGYRDFDDFLDSFNSRKRKNLRKERNKVKDQGVELITKTGNQITDDEWHWFYQFYHLTYFKRSGRQGYLNQDFFQRLAATMADSIVMVTAYHAGEMVAAALCFKDRRTLYGRYWGCSQEFEFLHFEACYYQGIDYAIANNLQRFDPGAQGEHKIQRGFTPIETYSNHWIAREDFRQAIDRFLAQEKQYNDAYLEEAKDMLPFRREAPR